jgi:hypothetical protein
LRSFLIRLISSFALAVPLSLSSFTQQPEAPAPSDQSAKKPDRPDAPTATQERPKEGKTELEKETGTINDRILTVMPNYGTVENAHALPPISSKQKFSLAAAGVFDYFAFPFDGALAAIDQAKNSPASWG